MLQNAMLLLEDTFNANHLSSKQLNTILEKYLKSLKMLRKITEKDKDPLGVVVDGIEGFMGILELSIFFKDYDN